MSHQMSPHKKKLMAEAKAKNKIKHYLAMVKDKQEVGKNGSK